MSASEYARSLLRDDCSNLLRAPVSGSRTSLSDGGASAMPVCMSARVVLFVDDDVSFALDFELAETFDPLSSSLCLPAWDFAAV